jgi:hypothetical protein
MPDTITASPELISIIERNFESKGLDYKGPMEWSATDEKSCCELTKDVIAFANTGGGYIVTGVSEVPGGFQLDGVTPDQATGWSVAVLRYSVSPRDATSSADGARSGES